MESIRNELGQPIGAPVEGWRGAASIPREPIIGERCRLEPLDIERHGPELYEADALDSDPRWWTYLAYGPFESLEDYLAWMRATCIGEDPLFFAIVDAHSGRATGLASYLRIDPALGSVEVGHIHYSSLLRRTPAATEAMYLMMRRAFELGYRRYEWKCDALNAGSRAAALRLGFSYEGVFRQAAVYKGRNRDTAWFACVDSEWPALEAAFRRWLDPGNFDEQGAQRVRLSDLTRPIVASDR